MNFQQIEEKPQDRNGWINKLFFLVGMSSLLPWNAVLQGFDFFILKFKDYDPAFTFTLALNGANGLVQIWAVYFNVFFSMNCRMYSSLGLLTALLVMIPLTSALIAEDIGFILAVIQVGLMGVAMSILLTSTFGLLAMLPGKYMGTAMTGLGFSGVFIGTIRIITLLIWSNNQNPTTGLLGACIYFTIAGILSIASLFAYRFIRYHPFTLSFTERQTLLDQSSQDPQDVSNQTKPAKNGSKHALQICITVKSIKWFMAALFLNMFITFLMFPGVVLEGSSPTLSPAWYAVLTGYVFNWGDLLGRYLCHHYLLLGPKTLWTGIFFRLIFIFTILLVSAPYSTPAWLFHSDWFIFLNLLLCGFTNGHMATLCMIYAPQQVPANLKQSAGTIMTMSLALGRLFAGFAAEFGMLKVDLKSI